MIPFFVDLASSGQVGQFLSTRHCAFRLSDHEVTTLKLVRLSGVKPSRDWPEFHDLAHNSRDWKALVALHLVRTVRKFATRLFLVVPGILGIDLSLGPRVWRALSCCPVVIATFAGARV
jgi:hypothetical protein